MSHATLAEIHKRIGAPPDGRSRRALLYERYEPYFAPFSDAPVKVLELGVHVGVSLKIFSSYFRNGTIVGLDVTDPGVDLSNFPNAVFEIGDQRNGDQLRAMSSRYAPDGWDIIIDDASHHGSWSLLSYDALLPCLKPGGLYVVEDWRTGYWDDWSDGSRYQRFSVEVPQDHIPRRVPSHDSGMVGFVKSLVDELNDRPVGGRRSPVGHPAKLEWMSFNDEFVVAKKRAG